MDQMKYQFHFEQNLKVKSESGKQYLKPFSYHF
jgi:hypothetical protein